MTTVAMFCPRAYRTSYDTLLEFPLFVHSDVERFLKMNACGSLNLSKINALKELTPAIHGMWRGKGERECCAVYIIR